MRVLAAFLVILLAGCAAVAPSYRDMDVPITSTTRFDPVKFAGQWEVVESTEDKVLPCGSSFHLLLEGDRYRFSCQYPLPDEGGLPGGYFDLAIERNGRLNFINAPEQLDPIWVLWVDEDFRTAVIGTPSGSFGMVINRGYQIRPDRLLAAREILLFNGYNEDALLTTLIE